MRWETGLGRRDLGVDTLRGVALMSMFVAHVAPTDGPGGLLNLSEYLTYPLFAAIVGMGATLGRDQPFRAALVRGGVLVATGLWLDERGSFVIIVLAYLGLLTWVMHPLARCRTPVWSRRSVCWRWPPPHPCGRPCWTSGCSSTSTAT